MLPIAYDEWKKVCNMFFNQPVGRQQAYLQWYPFSLLSKREKDYISSEEYFEQYIKCGLFATNTNNWIITDNYLQKNDGSFRNSVLVSPALFLILQCIGDYICKHYINGRDEKILVYYAGNFDEGRCYYKRDYDLFYKAIIAAQDDYKYFIKTDITDFYNNINLNKLFHMIDNNVNKEEIKIKQKDLFLFKEIVSICGMNRFPLAENSLASSFLSTVVYLDEVDQKLYSYLEKCKDIANFVMIRYVDDLYILFNSELRFPDLCFLRNDILSTYSSILKEYNLFLNANKSALKETTKISEELRKSLYIEYVLGEEYEFGELFSYQNIVEFLKEIKILILNGELTVEKYNETIERCFSVENIDLTANEIFNYFLYENKDIFKRLIVK